MPQEDILLHNALLQTRNELNRMLNRIERYQRRFQQNGENAYDIPESLSDEELTREQRGLRNLNDAQERLTSALDAINSERLQLRSDYT